MASFVKELANFYQTRLEGNGIEVIVQVPSKGFSVNMNRGKLTQVFDNLVLNAEYWLKVSHSGGLHQDGQDQYLRGCAVRAGGG